MQRQSTPTWKLAGYQTLSLRLSLVSIDPTGLSELHRTLYEDIKDGQ